MRSCMVMIGFLGCMAIAHAQDTPEQMIETFFATYEKGDAETALNDLYAHMPWSDRIKDDLDNLKMKLVGLQTVVGKYYGRSLIAQKELAGTYSIYSYLARFDQQPVRFVFQFYKPQEKWTLFAFSFDDNIDEEMEEAMKIYYLKLKE